jgi:hypothetical protein
MCAALALAAACVLVAIVGRGPGNRNTAVRHSEVAGSRESTQQVTTQQPGGSHGISRWQEARRGFDELENPTFTWPIQEKSPLMASTSTPSDLLY